MTDYSYIATMSASILGCGHSAQLFEVHFMAGTPQVHLHFMTEDDFNVPDHHGTLELCCHGCGASQLVFFEPHRIGKTRHQEVSVLFQRAHQTCHDDDYSVHCPNYRHSIEIVDLRGKISQRSTRKTRATT